MPPVRRQAVSPDGFLIETHQGIFEVTIAKAGNQWTVTALQDGVPFASIQFVNPNAQTVRTWLLTNFGVRLKRGAGASSVDLLGFDVQLVGLNPIDLRIITSNADVPIPDQWWVP